MARNERVYFQSLFRERLARKTTRTTHRCPTEKLIRMEAAVEKEFAAQKEQAQRELAAEQTAQSSTSNTNPTV